MSWNPAQTDRARENVEPAKQLIKRSGRMTEGQSACEEPQFVIPDIQMVSPRFSDSPGFAVVGSRPKEAIKTNGPGPFVPRETVHAFKNVGSTKGRIRYFFSLALKIEEMFQAIYAAQEAGNLTEQAMAMIAARHGQSFAGPPL